MGAEWTLLHSAARVACGALDGEVSGAFEDLVRGQWQDVGDGCDVWECAEWAVRVENGELSAGYRDADSSVDPVLVSDGWDHADELTVGVNAAFLRDGLRFVGEGEPVRMISELRPVLLGGKYDRCYLVMPVRLKTDANDPFAAAALSAV